MSCGKVLFRFKGLNPTELAYKIKDFISKGKSTSPESGLGDKNRPYQREKPPYNVKGLPLNSIEELKLIDGWDDAMQAVFSEYLTVYPVIRKGQPKELQNLNLNMVNKELFSCLIPSSVAGECVEKFSLAWKKIKKDNKDVVGAGVEKSLKDIACYNSEQDQVGSIKTKPANWFGNRSSVFKLEIEARTGKQNRKLEVIVRRIMPKDKSGIRNRQKHKRAYEILSWRMT